MTDLAPFRDLDQELCDLLADLGTTGTVTPSDLQQHLPFHRVKRFGGDDDLTTDTARITIDTFAGTYAAARTAAEAVRQRLISHPHRSDAGVIDRVTTTTAPVEVPWADPNIRRLTATYTVSARR